MTLLIACGLKREARIFERAGGDVVAVAGGGDAARLERGLEDEAEIFPGIILSCGIAGALSPDLHTGDVIIDGDATVVALLRAALPDAIAGQVAGGNAIVATAAAKSALASRTGAIAADMESHIASRVARSRDLPFGVLRVISDTADDDLPPAALVGMRPDGGMALGAVLASLARRPRQLPALLRTGRQAGAAFAALERAFDAIIAAGMDRVDMAAISRA